MPVPAQDGSPPLQWPIRVEALHCGRFGAALPHGQLALAVVAALPIRAVLPVRPGFWPALTFRAAVLVALYCREFPPIRPAAVALLTTKWH